MNKSSLKDLINEKKFPYDSSAKGRNLLDTSDLDTFMEVHQEYVKSCKRISTK